MKCLPNYHYHLNIYRKILCPVAQSVTCLTTDEGLIADPGVTSSITVWSYTSMVIEHDIISMVILLPSTDSFKKGCFQLQAKSMYTNYWLTASSSLPMKSVVRLTDFPHMTIAVGWDVKQ